MWKPNHNIMILKSNKFGEGIGRESGNHCSDRTPITQKFFLKIFENKIRNYLLQTDRNS